MEILNKGNAEPIKDASRMARTKNVLYEGGEGATKSDGPASRIWITILMMIDSYIILDNANKNNRGVCSFSILPEKNSSKSLVQEILLF